MAKVRVLEVIRDAEGGMKRHVETLVSGLDKEQYDIFIACSENQWTRSFSANGGVAAFYRIDLGDKHGAVALFNSFLALRKIIASEDVDIVHAHGNTCTILATLAALGNKKAKIISTLHNFPGVGIGYKRLIYPILLGIALRTCYHIIFVSEALMKYARAKWNIPADKTTVIYNGIDVKAIEQSSEHLGHDMLSVKGRQAPVFLCVARLIPEKGVDILIKAAAMLLQKCGGDTAFPRFLIAGDGPEFEKLQQMPQQLDIDRHVEFLGFRADIYRWIRACDVVVLPSYSEGLGLSLLEAMALKKPVIGTSVGGIPEIVATNKNGLLIPPGDVKALSKALWYFTQSPEIAKEMGQAGYELLNQRFTQEKMVYEFEFLLNRVCSPKNSFRRQTSPFRMP